MSAAVLYPPPLSHDLTRAVVIRSAPRREPPFDDELIDSAVAPGKFDCRLPFDVPKHKATVWRSRPAHPSGLPEPGPWGRRLLIGLVETAGGKRPWQQLAALLSPAVSRGLGADFDQAVRRGNPHWLHRGVIRTVRASEPSTGVAELCATIEHGTRVRAVALRLEAHCGRWRCTRIQLG